MRRLSRTQRLQVQAMQTLSRHWLGYRRSLSIDDGHCPCTQMVCKGGVSNDPSRGIGSSPLAILSQRSLLHTCLCPSATTSKYVDCLECEHTSLTGSSFDVQISVNLLPEDHTTICVEPHLHRFIAAPRTRWRQPTLLLHTPSVPRRRVNPGRSCPLASIGMVTGQRSEV